MVIFSLNLVLSIESWMVLYKLIISAEIVICWFLSSSISWIFFAEERAVKLSCISWPLMIMQSFCKRILTVFNCLMVFPNDAYSLATQYKRKREFCGNLSSGLDETAASWRELDFSIFFWTPFIYFSFSLNLPNFVIVLVSQWILNCNLFILSMKFWFNWGFFHVFVLYSFIKCSVQIWYNK